MAVVKNLLVRAGADFSAITKQANKAKTSMSGMQTSVSKSCSRMSTAVGSMNKVFATLGVTISVAAIVAAGKKAKEAFDEQTEASAKLAQVMRNTMSARSEEIKSVEDLIDAQERLGVVDGATQTEAAQELGTYLTTASALKTLIPVLNDMVAQQYGLGASAESAVSIATMMGKVMNGQVSALSRYGYSFTAAQEAVLKYGDEAQRAATLAAVVEESVGGMNAALAATPSGRLQQVSNSLGKIQESFGQAVSSVATLFIPALNTACSVLATLATLANKVAQSLANVFGRQSSGASTAVTYTAAAAGAMSDLTDETEAAGAAAKKNLSAFGFDTLQKLSSTASSSGAAAAGEDGGAAGGTISETATGADEAGESIGWLEAGLNRIKATMASLNFGPLTTALGKLKEAVAPLTRGLFSGLEWAYTNIFEPLAKWTVEDALPAFLGALAGAAQLLSSALAVLQPVARWLWDSFLQPLAAWTGGVFIGALETITDLFQDLSDLISGNTSFVDFLSNLSPAESVLAGIASAIGSIVIAAGGLTALNVITTFISNIKSLNAVGIVGKLAQVFALTAGGAGTLSEAMQLVFGPGSIIAGIAAIVGGAVTALSNFMAMLKDGFSWTNEALMGLGIAIAAVGAVVVGAPATVAAAIAAIVASVATAVVLIKEHWEDIKAAGTAAWETVKNVWGAASAWFDKKVISPITTGFRSFANGIIGFFEGLVNGAIDGINSIIRAFNKIHFTIPDWVPVIGGNSWGFSLETYPNISLPRLANGAVFEGNNPYLAVVNDQKHGVNVESPLSTIVEAMMIALKSTNYGDNIEVNVKAVFDGQLAALARLLRPYFEADAKRVGNRASTAKGTV